MKRAVKNFFLWDVYKPLFTLAGAGLIVMASSRLAFALVTAAALLWVYNATMAALFFGRPVYPKTPMGKVAARITLTSVLGSLFLLFLRVTSPLLAMETACLVLLTPCYVSVSPLFDKPYGSEISSLLLKASLEAGSLGALIVAFALIREPVGFMALSLPGGASGIIELFSPPEGDGFLPVRIIAGSAGALLLLGYGAALFRGRRRPPRQGAEA
jgi:hypothetical protein